MIKLIYKGQTEDYKESLSLADKEHFHFYPFSPDQADNPDALREMNFNLAAMLIAAFSAPDACQRLYDSTIVPAAIVLACKRIREKFTVPKIRIIINPEKKVIRVRFKSSEQMSRTSAVIFIKLVLQITEDFDIQIIDHKHLVAWTKSDV